MAGQNDLRIQAAGPETVDAALELVFGDWVDPVARRNQIESIKARAEKRIPEGLFVAIDFNETESTVAGAVLVEGRPGKAAYVHPPRGRLDLSTETFVQLLDVASGWLESKGFRMAQALLPVGAAADEAVLVAAEFRRLADLAYLESRRESFPIRRPDEGRFELVPVTPADLERLRRIVEKTFEETLDCPALSGVQSIEEVFEGYWASSAGETRFWRIVCRGGEEVGVLLVADHPDEALAELVYMGLIPSARGQGGGREIARQAQWLAVEAGRDRLVVGVDEANGPALEAYTGVGFEAWEKRVVYTKFFH